MSFEKFPKVPRFNREVVITEKIDGTNAQIHIASRTEILEYTDEELGGTNRVLGYDQEREYYMLAGSRTRLLSPGGKWDNFGFAAWVKENSAELWKLGPGRHYGEWWGKGIQRGYGLEERRFSLFNVNKWGMNAHGIPEQGPDCVSVVPTLLVMGEPHTDTFDVIMRNLATYGSWAVKDYMDPEGIMIFHTASNSMYKVTVNNDEGGKG